MFAGDALAESLLSVAGMVALWAAAFVAYHLVVDDDQPGKES